MYRRAAGDHRWHLIPVVAVGLLNLSAAQNNYAGLGRAQALLAQGKESAALTELEAVLKSDPDNLFALGNAGLISARRGRFSAAARYLSQAHKLRPADLQLSLALLEVYARSDRKQDAERLVTDLQSAAKLSEQQSLGAAKLLFRLGSYRVAESLLTTEASDSVARHDLLGACYAATGDVSKASDEFQASIRLDPANERRYFRLGMLYLKYRTPELATIVFNKGLARKPQSPLLWLALGVSQSLDEKTEAAEQSLRHAIDLDPHFTDAYLLLGEILEQEKPREALELFRDNIQQHPDLAVSYYLYGRLALYLGEGAIQDTIAKLRRAIALEPNFAESHFELGRALEQAGNDSEAAAQFEECLRLNPKLSKAHYRLAVLYKKLGYVARSAAALKAFQTQQKLEEPDTALKRLEYRIEQP